MKRVCLVVPMVLMLMLISYARAVTSLEVVVPDINLPLLTQNDLYIDFDFYLSDQHLTIDLTSGSIVYDACPVCDSSLVLTTEFFIGGPENPPDQISFDAMTSTELDVTWAPKPLTILDQDNLHVARVWLSSDAQGTWSYQGNEAHPAALLPAAPIIHGSVLGGVMHIIPEPTSLALALSLAATLCCQRRIPL
jgi:hypothetical protein